MSEGHFCKRLPCLEVLSHAVCRRRIAESLKRVNRDQEARQARSDSTTGVPKTCALCGQPGHNKRTCPQSPEAQARSPCNPICTPPACNDV